MFFSCSGWASVLQLVPTASCSATGHHQKEPGPMHLTLIRWIFISTGGILSQPSLHQEEQLQVSPLPHTGGAPGPSSSLSPSTKLSLEFPYLSWAEEPKTGHSTPDVLSPKQSRWGRTPPSTSWPRVFLNTPQDTIGLLGHRGTLLAHSQPVFHQDTQVLLLRSLFQQVSP